MRTSTKAIIGIVATVGLFGGVAWAARKTKELEAGTSLMTDFTLGRVNLHQGNLVIDIPMVVSNTRRTPIQIDAISVNGYLKTPGGTEARVGQVRDFFKAPAGTIQGMGVTTIPIKFVSNWMQILGAMGQQVNLTSVANNLFNIFKKPENRTQTQTASIGGQADFRLEGFIVAGNVRFPINETIPVNLPNLA